MHGIIEPAVRVEWRALAELGPVLSAWRDLATRAIEPNIFYEPSFATAAAPLFGHDVGAGLVWSRDASPRLLGLFPARIERRRYSVPLHVLTGWTHPYAPLGAPLVDRELCEPAVAAWLDHIARDPRLPKLVLLPYLPAGGALAAAIDAVLEQRGGKSACFSGHGRALLAPCGERATYLARALDGKKRKELRRQRRRLAEEGRLVSDGGATGSASAALDDFLSLEAKGWKGRAGTAARCNPDVLEFMRRAVGALADESKAKVARLSVGGRPIAALVTLRSGQAAWCWKIAYDENYARFSPGVQIVLDVTEDLLRDGTIACVDSCATPDHPMIDHVWRERLALADRLIGLDPGQALRFAFACRLERARRSAIDLAKAIRNSLWTRSS